MKKIYKNINIVLIFTLIGMFLWQDFAYSLRPPLQSSAINKELIDSRDKQVVEVFKLLQGMAAQIEVVVHKSNLLQQIAELREWCDIKGNKDIQKARQLTENIKGVLENDILPEIYQITELDQNLYFGEEIVSPGRERVTYDFVDKLVKLIMGLAPTDETKVKEYIHALDVYMGLLRDIRSPGEHILEVAGNMSESKGEPAYTYRFLEHYYGIIHRLSFVQPPIVSMGTASGESKELTFIEILQGRFVSYLNSGTPLQILDIGTGYNGSFTIKLDAFLKSAGIKAKICGIAPNVYSTYGGPAREKGVELRAIEFETLMEEESERNKYHIITINAPDFIRDYDKFFQALDLLLTPDGIIIFRLSTEPGSEITQKAFKAKFERTGLWNVQNLNYEIKDLPEGRFRVLPPLLIQRSQPKPTTQPPLASMETAGDKNDVYRKIEEIVKRKAKDKVVLTIEGNAGSGKNFIANLIKETGIHNFDAKEIAIVDIDTYLPETVDDGIDTMLRDSDGTLFIPLGDWTKYIKYDRFKKDFESLSREYRMIVVVGLYMPKFFEQVKSFRPDIRIGLEANDEVARMRVLRRDGYIRKYTDSLDVIEKMKDISQAIPIDLVVDNSVRISKEAKLTSGKTSQISIIESSIYGGLEEESAYRITSENEFELLNEIIVLAAKSAELSYKIDNKSYELSNAEAVVAGTFSILRYLFNLGEKSADVTIKRYKDGIEIIVESETQQIPEPGNVQNTLLRPAISHVPEVVIVNRLNGYSRTFGSRWSDDWIPESGAIFALGYPQKIPDMEIGWRTWIRADSTDQPPLASMETAQTSLVDLVSKEAKEVEAVKSLEGSCVMNALLAWRLRHNPDLEVDVVKKSIGSGIHYYLLVAPRHSKIRFIVDIFSPEYTAEYIMSGHVKVLVLPIDEAAQFSKWYKGYKKCDEKELQFLSRLIKKDGTEKSSLASNETAGTKQAISVDHKYEDLEKEKIYYETIIEWVTYILENYKTRFGGNKLIFIGGACKRAYQAAVALCDRYDVNEKDIIYLDLPRVVHRRTGAEIIAQYLEERGLFEKEAPIAIFDNMVNSEGHYSTFGKVTEAIRIKHPQTELIYYIMSGVELDSYSKDFSGAPRKVDNINLTAIFMGASNWMKTDVRREQPILYDKKGNKIVPIYLDFKKLAQFLSEIKEGSNIFTLSPGLLSKESQDIFPLVHILIRDMGFHSGHSIDWMQVYKQLKALCESGSLQKADIQDKIFLGLLQQQRMQPTESVRGKFGIIFKSL